MDKKQALEHRRVRKAKKPVFHRQDSHKKAKLSSSWRKPRGYQSKMRLGRRGYSRSISSGYGSPKQVEGSHKSGLFPVLVSTSAQLDALGAKTQGAVLTAGLGAKRREQLLEHAAKKAITVLNLDAEALSRIKERFAAQKKERSDKRASKAKKAEKKTLEQKAKSEQAEAAKAAEPTDAAAPEPSEEKEKAFAAEKQKVLTKKM